MLWHTEPTSFDSSTMYVSGEWRIRHMTKGFGISVASVFLSNAGLGARLVMEFTGLDALDTAMNWCADQAAKFEAGSDG